MVMWANGDNDSKSEGSFCNEVHVHAAASIPYFVDAASYLLPWSMRPGVRADSSFLYWMAVTYPCLHPFYPWPETINVVMDSDGHSSGGDFPSFGPSVGGYWSL